MAVPLSLLVSASAEIKHSPVQFSVCVCFCPHGVPPVSPKHNRQQMRSVMRSLLCSTWHNHSDPFGAAASHLHDSPSLPVCPPLPAAPSHPSAPIPLPSHPLPVPPSLHPPPTALSPAMHSKNFTPQQLTFLFFFSFFFVSLFVCMRSVGFFFCFSFSSIKTPSPQTRGGTATSTGSGMGCRGQGTWQPAPRCSPMHREELRPHCHPLVSPHVTTRCQPHAPVPGRGRRSAPRSRAPAAQFVYT